MLILHITDNDGIIHAWEISVNVLILRENFHQIWLPSRDFSIFLFLTFFFSIFISFFLSFSLTFFHSLTSWISISLSTSHSQWNKYTFLSYLFDLNISLAGFRFGQGGLNDYENFQTLTMWPKELISFLFVQFEKF